MPDLETAGLPLEWLSRLVLQAAGGAGFGVCVTRTTPDGLRNVYANEVAASTLGWPLDELLARSPLELLAPEDLARMSQLRGEVAASPSFHDVTCLRKDGTRVPVEFAAVGLLHEGERVTVSFFLDASARRRAEAQRLAGQERFRELILGAPDGIVLSRGGQIVFANPAAARLLGVAEVDKLVGRRFAEFLQPEDLARMGARLQSVARGERNAPVEYVARRDDGATVIAEITSLLTEFEGAPAVLGFARDVTERVKMREQLARAHRLASIGTLAAGVAHEINNPLTFMTLGTGLLASRIRASSATEGERAAMLATLAEVEQGIERVAGVVRDLSAFSRVEEDTTQAVDLAVAVESARRIVSHRTRHAATVEVALGTIPHVEADPRKLEQVFVNLLINAAQALEGARRRGTIRISAQATSGGTVEVAVTDDGPGIPAGLEERVFDPFFTTKPVGEGTGLGLAVCHGIMSQLGGSISVESGPGGTTFRLVLLARDPAPRSPPREGVREITRRNVLVVDDEQGVARAVAATLRAHHGVTAVTTRQLALAELAGTQSFDVVLCDLATPGMTGLELHERASEMLGGATPRFVFMTGGAISESERSFLESWRGPLLRKPFGASELEEALQLGASRG